MPLLPRSRLAAGARCHEGPALLARQLAHAARCCWRADVLPWCAACCRHKASCRRLEQVSSGPGSVTAHPGLGPRQSWTGPTRQDPPWRLQPGGMLCDAARGLLVQGLGQAATARGWSFTPRAAAHGGDVVRAAHPVRPSTLPNLLDAAAIPLAATLARPGACPAPRPRRTPWTRAWRRRSCRQRRWSDTGSCLQGRQGVAEDQREAAHHHRACRCHCLPEPAERQGARQP